MIEISHAGSNRASRSFTRAANLAERIYRQLKQDITDFRLLPGDRFTETEVAERMGVSRTPVREALFRLQREGHVEVLFRNGWRVRPFDFGYFENLYDVRIILECAAVQRLCHAEELPAQLKDLMRIWLVPEGTWLKDMHTLSALDERFHEMLVEAAGNIEMALIHHDITEKIRIIRRLDFSKSQRVKATYVEHGLVLEAILDRQPRLAQMELTKHIEESRREVRNITLHMLQCARQEAQTEF